MSFIGGCVSCGVRGADIPGIGALPPWAANTVGYVLAKSATTAIPEATLALYQLYRVLQIGLNVFDSCFIHLICCSAGKSRRNVTTPSTET